MHLHSMNGFPKQVRMKLPQFTKNLREQSGHGLKVPLIGLLQHLRPHHLHLFAMTDNHSSGSNRVVDVIHRFINDKYKEGRLQRNP